jgi:hypothetical protein
MITKADTANNYHNRSLQPEKPVQHKKTVAHSTLKSIWLGKLQ